MNFEDTVADIMRQFPHLDHIQLRAMLNDEIDASKTTIEEAAGLIRLWLDQAEIRFDNLPKFVAHHRHAYVWAALVREQMKQPGE